jgi:hypothetical protein
MREFKAYDRLPAESESQYLAFMCYRDQRTGRNLSKAYGRKERLPKRNTTVERTRTHRTKCRDGDGIFFGMNVVRNGIGSITPDIYFGDLWAFSRNLESRG